MPELQSSQVPIGTVLDGKYRVTKEIGRGGMAAVFEAVNIDIGKHVAVKVLSADLITSRIVRERFIREARAAAAIHSPYICEVYDSGMYDERPFLVMELLRGESLYDRMTRIRQLRTSATLRVMQHVVRGLGKAHEVNVVHRDLKPENIFLTRDTDGRLLAKIVDFGLAKFYEGQGEEEKNVRLTREGALFGTPAYMSPEQARGQGEVDHRADLWALGCIVYECLTGRTVWDVQQGVAMILAQIARGTLPNPREHRPDLPESFVHWFYRALHPDLNQRYQSAREFLESLEAALESADIGPPSSDQRAFLPPTSDIPDPAMFPAQEAAAPEPEAASGRAIAWLLAAAGLAAAGYGYWLYALHPSDGRLDDHTATLGQPAETERVPAEKGPGADLISRGQAFLRKDQAKEAMKAFEAASGENPHVARSLINHTEVALQEAENGPCQLAGIGRPRPFAETGPASHARLSLGREGLLAAWTDTHEDAKRRNVYATLLDDSLRRVGPVRNVTPEASAAVEPTFIPLADGFAVVYWDSGSAGTGVYVRAVESDGRIRTPARLLTEEKPEKYFPSVTPLPGGKMLAVWSEKRGTIDAKAQLIARTLDRDLEPEGSPVELTALLQGDATQPHAEIFGNRLFVGYRYQSSPTSTDIRLLRIDLDDGTLPSPAIFHLEEDRYVGESIVLRSQPRQAEPSLICDAEGCLVTWDDDQGGAFSAFVPHNQNAPLWHREFSSKGKRPAIARNHDGMTAIAYFAGDRLFLAPVTRDGVGAPSVVSRVSGFQPSPELIAGAAPGEWLIAWRDFEAGHLEIFVARAQCPERTAP